MKNFIGSWLSTNIKESVRNCFNLLGYNLYRMNEHERQYLKEQKNSKASSPAIFVDSLEYLANLRERYANVRLPIANHSVWQSRGTNQNTADIGWIKVDLQNFRENNAYVFSYLRNDPLVSRLTYFIFADAVRLKDASGLLKKLTEDGAFGCQTCEYPGIGRVSRDLLDSVLEINFLQKHLRILDRDDLNILDIGAGYGRMAHRIMTANPKLQSYTCVDAIPESTFLSEFYLKHRGLANNTRVIPLDEVDQTLAKPGSYDLALNIHSFSECTYAAVEWWLSRIAQLRVKHLMIIPNESEEFLTVEQDRSRRDFRPLIEELGFKLIAKESVFDDPAVRELMNVNDYMFLFELNLT